MHVGQVARSLGCREPRGLRTKGTESPGYKEPRVVKPRVQEAQEAREPGPKETQPGCLGSTKCKEPGVLEA